MFFIISALFACGPPQVIPTDPTLNVWKEDFTPIEDVPEVTDCLGDLAELPPEYQQDAAIPATLVVVYKRQQKIGLYKHGKLASLNGQTACYSMALGSWPYEGKLRMDNQSTPEGWYNVARKRTENPYDLWPSTSFYKALHISYPAKKDVEEAYAQGVIDASVAANLLASIKKGELPNQSTPMGGQILVHGWDDSLPGTFGCVGMRNADIDLLFDAVKEGDQILILPWKRILYQDATYGIDKPPKRPPPRKRRPTP